MDIWNNSLLAAPPVNTYKCDNNAGDILQLQKAISDAIYTLENQKPLHQEAALISRLIYTLGRKFRHDIGYSYIKRTNAALLKYLNLKLLNDLQSFSSVLPCTKLYSYLPTRQMLDYVLVRIQTFSKIMHRIITCSKKSAIHFLDRLKKCESAHLSLMPLSILSKIWTLSKNLFENACEWYNVMYNFRDNLNMVGAHFLPENYVFPPDLKEWNSCDYSEENLEQVFGTYFESRTVLKKDNLSNLINPSSIDDDYDKTPKNLTDNIISTYPALKNQVSEITDVGESVSRQKFKQLQDRNSITCTNNYSSDNRNSANLFPIKSKTESNVFIDGDLESKNQNKTLLKLSVSSKSNRLTKNKNTFSLDHSLQSVISFKTLLRFLEKEDLYRTNSDPNSLTRDLGLMQWQTLKNILIAKMKKLECLNNKKKSYKKIHKIWEERCPTSSSPA